MFKKLLLRLKYLDKLRFLLFQEIDARAVGKLKSFYETRVSYESTSIESLDLKCSCKSFTRSLPLFEELVHVVVDKLRVIPPTNVLSTQQQVSVIGSLKQVFQILHELLTHEPTSDNFLDFEGIVISLRPVNFEKVP